MSLSVSCFFLKGSRSQQSTAAAAEAMTHTFQLLACHLIFELLLLLTNVTMVALVLVLWAVSSSTSFAFSSFYATLKLQYKPIVITSLIRQKG
jgi:hypothetical protein